jgi:hypothetical protein
MIISDELKTMLAEIQSKNRYPEYKMKTNYIPMTNREALIEILDYTGVEYKIKDTLLSKIDEEYNETI